uniref:PiggyBac transposable element-derived protein domain-containing protein n=1 Tax=Romanomermis culicivorax TaxID=13658 RepID=A0A915IZ26_ROMCU
ILPIEEGGGPKAQVPACSQQALENPLGVSSNMESKTSHIRITQNGIQRTADIHQIIDDFGIISSDEEADDAFDVAAEVQEMYNTVKLYTNGIEEEAFEDNEPDSDTDDIPLAELVRIPKSSTTNKNQSKEFHVYHWRKRTSPHVDSEYTGPTFSEPLVGLWPCDYFMLFVDKSMIDNCFEQTNLYAAQKAIAKGLSVPFTTTTDSIEQFFGILLFMGITKFPSYRMYWAEETRVSAVTDIMSRNDFENLKSYMHFNDDSLMLKRESDNYDPIYKARPFVNQLRQNCLKIEPEEKHSIDKMIIPTKARWGIKQYIPSKPHPWGMKIFSRCGVLGFVYDFFVFTGADKNPTEQALSASSNVVARLCTTLPKNVGHKVYFDNYFTSPDLLIYLYSQGIFALGTVPSNGLRGAEKLLISKKDLKAKGRGSHDFIVDANLTLCALRWLDNGPKRDVITPKFRPNLDEMHPEIERGLERMPQNQERFHPQERAPEMSNQELVTQLRELKGTIKAVLDIIANATTEDNKREANSHQQELDRQ